MFKLNFAMKAKCSFPQLKLLKIEEAVTMTAFQENPLQTFACLKRAIETLEKYMKYDQS